MKNFIKKKSLFGFILLLLAIGVTNAQMGIGTDEPDDSALLDIKASDKGLLIPRMDLGDLSSAGPVNAPIESLLVYNTDSTNTANNKVNAGFYYWVPDSGANATTGDWIPISNPAAIGKDVNSGGSITIGSGAGAALTAMTLNVNVDNKTIKIDTDTTINADGTVSITGTGKLYVNLKENGGLIKDDETGVISVSIGGATDADGNEIGTGTESDPGAGKDVTSDGSITVTNGSGAAFTEMGLKVNVDGATIEVDGTSKKVQIKNGGVTTDKILDGAVTKDKILDGAVAPLKIHGDIAGAGLTRDGDGVLSVNIGGGDGILGDGTGSDGDNKGAGKDVTSDGSITVTNGSGAAFTEMGLKVNVDGATIEVDGTSKKVQIKNGGVTTDKILDNAVKTAKINNGAVTDLKIATNAVKTAKINNGAVTDLKIATNAVKTAKINNGAVTDLKIATNAVKTAKINNGAVTTVKIAANAVTAGKIVDGAVTAGKILADAVTTAKIADSTVTTAKIANSAVMPLKIHEDIAGEGISRSDAGILSVDIGTTGIGQNVTSTNGSITGGVANAALVTMDLQVKVDNETIKINADTTENSTEKGKLYVNAPYSNNSGILTIRKWFEGKDIYEVVKTSIITAAGGSTKLTIVGGIDHLTQVLNIRIIAKATTGENANVGGVHHSKKYNKTANGADDTITVGSGKMSSKLPAGTYFIIVEYLKTIPPPTTGG